jgi:hypothetical protein
MRFLGATFRERMVFRLATLALISVLIVGGLFLILRHYPPAATPAERSLDLEIRGDAMSPEEVSVREVGAGQVRDDAG